MQPVNDIHRTPSLSYLSKNDLQDFLDEYFRRQGVVLERQSVRGEDCLSLAYPDGSGLFGIDSCLYGWSCAELWEDWCCLQDRLDWHACCAKSLVYQAILDKEKREKFNHWLHLKGRCDLAGLYSEADILRTGWPWSSICQKAGHTVLTFQGWPWDLEKKIVLPEATILDLNNACQNDTFDPSYPLKYLRAISSLLVSIERDHYSRKVPPAQKEDAERRYL